MSRPTEIALESTQVACQGSGSHEGGIYAYLPHFESGADDWLRQTGRARLATDNEATNAARLLDSQQDQGSPARVLRDGAGFNVGLQLTLGLCNRILAGGSLAHNNRRYVPPGGVHPPMSWLSS